MTSAYPLHYQIAFIRKAVETTICYLHFTRIHNKLTFVWCESRFYNVFIRWVLMMNSQNTKGIPSKEEWGKGRYEKCQRRGRNRSHPESSLDNHWVHFKIRSMKKDASRWFPMFLILIFIILVWFLYYYYYWWQWPLVQEKSTSKVFQFRERFWGKVRNPLTMQTYVALLLETMAPPILMATLLCPSRPTPTPNSTQVSRWTLS